MALSRKHIVSIVGIVLIASTLSAYVAYRLGLRRAGGTFSSSPASATGGGTEGGCVDYRDAASLSGKDACISARVLRVFTSRAGNTFLDFCTDYRKCPFTSVIFESDSEKFGDLNTLRGRRVEIRGLVTEYQGRAEIIIRNPEQIRVLP
ncbi:MAG TPA: hypothetical protein VM182_05460 [Terriglobia bacterium]|nr:hypothetical protein [Terriglobia bacterium]